jgi:hypothetical protein
MRGTGSVMSRKTRPVILTAVVIVLLACTGLAAAFWLRERAGSTSTFSASTASASHEKGYTWRVTSGASSKDLAQMDSAVAAVMAEHPTRLQEGEQISFEAVRVSGDWALTEPIFRTASSDQMIGEGLLILLHKVNGNWQAAYPGTPEFNAWLDDFPSEPIPTSTKQLLR